jgi:hypothetical protein
MKKLLALTLITALLLSLTACSNEAAVTGTGDAIGDPEDAQEVLSFKDDLEGVDSLDWNPWGMQREAPDFSNLTIFPDRNSGESLIIPDMWITELGAYFVEITMLGMDIRPDGSVIYDGEMRDVALLNIFDSATGQQMVLCNRITCPHSSEDCMAFLPPEPPDPIEGDGWGMTSVSHRGWGSSPCLFIDDGQIYALNGGRTFYRFNLDGTGRTEYMRLPEKYDFSWSRNWLMNGKLYMMASFLVPLDDGFGSLSSAPAMLEVDYINKTTNVIWEGEQNSWVEVLGLWDGMLYLMQTVYPEVDWDSADDMQRYYDEQEITISSYNPANGQTTEIFSDISYGYQFNSWAIDENSEMFFHSRRDETLGRFNIRTGTITVLAENIGGQIWMGLERDGRLILTREHSWTDRDTPWLYMKRDLFFLELATGELTELTIRTRQNIGENPPADILWEEDGYFYFIIEQIYEEQTGDWGWGIETWYDNTHTKLGRALTADYWASNTDAVEELDWYEPDEWWEFYSEKMGWGGAGYGRVIG